MHHRPGGASRPHTTETGWKDLSGGSAEEGSSRVMLSPLLTWPAMQTRDSSGPSRPSHVLRRLLPKPKHTGYLLRPRPHGYELPAKDEHNFISRMLHKKHLLPEMNEERGPSISGLDSLVFFPLEL